MASLWSLSIGISQYQYFQPLNYAQQDAKAVHSFLVGEAGFPLEQCFLLTDTSPPLQGRSTYPTRANLQTWIQDICQKPFQPGDLLWCFFSGYGICYQGQDYLMPVNGDPADVLNTGIPVRSLLEALHRQVAAQVVLFLDMSRNQVSQFQGIIGVETMSLSREFQIPTVLSCQAGEFSSESPDLGHGCFTIALLEGLRYHQCTTLQALHRYLGDRLQQLNNQHWQPVQHPVIVGEAGNLALPLLPVTFLPNHAAAVSMSGNPQDSSPQSAPERSPIPDSSPPASDPRPNFPEFVATSTRFPPPDPDPSDWAPTPSTSRVGLLDNPPDPRRAQNLSVWDIQLPSASTEPAIAPDSTSYPASGSSTMTSSQPNLNPKTLNPLSTPQPESGEPEIDDALFWRRLLTWGGSLVLVLCIGVIARNLGAFTGKNNPTSPAPVTASTQPAAHTGQASPLPSPATNPGKTSPIAWFPAVQTAFNTEKYEDALKILDQVPADQRTPTYTTVRTQVEQQISQSTLEQARSLLHPNQASRFNKAIESARNIKPGQPFYEQAQQDIDRWSLVILDLASGRAKTGNYEAAIKAASLVPDDRPKLHAQAQQAIAQWRKLAEADKNNAALIVEAASSTQWGNASSYNRAIAALQAIKPGQPKYPAAQQLIQAWSQSILDMAIIRANRGRIQPAIQTARLVPENTAAYAKAQQKIAEWKR